MKPIIVLFYNERTKEKPLSDLPCLRTHIKLVIHPKNCLKVGKPFDIYQLVLLGLHINIQFMWYLFISTRLNVFRKTYKLILTNWHVTKLQVYNLTTTSSYLPLDLLRHQTYKFKHTNWHPPKKMSLEVLTDNIVQLCEECNVWSSTINIPHGNGDFLDISVACGSQASTPKCAEI